MIRLTGKIVYAPKTHLKSSDKWMILSCEEEVGRYYRELYHKEFFYKKKIMRPVWGSHVSVIRNETILNPDAWGFAANKIIKIEYEPGVRDNGEYFWLKVHCDELCAIRELFGLPREPKFGLHLTIGRVT